MLTALARRVLRVALAKNEVASEIADLMDNPVVNRIAASGGTALVAGDFALSGGFGSTGSVAVTSGSTDTRGEITITSAGTGQGASPTCTLTFKDGTFTTAPFAIAGRSGGSQLTVDLSVTCTATTMVITLLGTPVAAETYKIVWHVIK